MGIRQYLQVLVHQRTQPSPCPYQLGRIFIPQRVTIHHTNQVGFIILERLDFKAFLADGDDIHPPHAQGFNFCDERSTTDAERFRLPPYFRAAFDQGYTKGLFPLVAATNHQLIAFFKNMQPQRHSREQNRI